MPKDIQAHLRNETVSELDPTPVLGVGPETPVRDAVALMQERRIGCVLICQGSDLLGIFTERDYVQRVLGRGVDLNAPISACMSSKPVTICSSDTVASLIERIHKGRYRRLPVVDDAGQLVGLVTVRNLVHHLAEHYPAAVFNLAPVSKPVQQAREGA